MSFFGSVVDELDVALRSGSPGRRTEVLRQVTSLFLNDAEKLSENQVALFDDVLARLVEEIEIGALAELSSRLAPVPNAPRTMIRKLATIDAIEVAGPILEQSDRLTDQDLIEIANTKGQAHQLKIAGRSSLNEAVTEVLIDRCDVAVATKVAGNSGARISSIGFSKLAMLAEGNDQLTATMAKRADIPPRQFRELLSRATEAVQQTLLASTPPAARDRLKRVLSDISGQISSRVTANHYAEAQRYVSAFSQDTALCRRKLVEFAKAKIVGKTVATLSLLSAVPIDLIDRLIYDSSPYGVMVLCKVLGLDWTIACAVMAARPRPEGEDAALDLDDLQKDFEKLTAPAAQRLLRFWQSGQTSPAMRPKTLAAPVVQAPELVPADATETYVLQI
jgi:uncharacterized protein (DUF2336 family)